MTRDTKRRRPFPDPTPMVHVDIFRQFKAYTGVKRTTVLGVTLGLFAFISAALIWLQN